MINFKEDTKLKVKRYQPIPICGSLQPLNGKKMICVVSNNEGLRRELGTLLGDLNVPCRILDSRSDLAISSVYATGVTALVVDGHLPSLTKGAWLDLLGSLARRIPVFILGQPDLEDFSVASRNSELLAWIESPEPAAILELLEACGATGINGKKILRHKIPIYNTQVPLHLLQSHGALSILTINATSFRKISIDCGVEAYQKLQECFHQILVEMWGNTGHFRRNDIIMRRSQHSNTYFVFLEQSRISRTVPAPGVLEKMADRIAYRIQDAIWMEIFKDKAVRHIPECIQLAPEVAIGHATALYNPTVDSVDVLERLFETSSEVSKVQLRRIRDRERELMQTIVQSREILYPNYQAIFTLQNLTKENVDDVIAVKSIAPIKNLIFGFESLIRARKDLVDEKLSGDHLVYMNSKLLRPDILFGMASHCKVALELDQICLALGVNNAVDLPGKLMVNILPRNFVHLERLMYLMNARGKIVFEISESEGIANPTLMYKIRDYVAALDCTIAADDFGKGHTSIERVIKLRPEIIKLDRSLVDKINVDEAKKSFVNGIVQAAKIINATVLAEGVETWEEALTFQEMGVELIQGFLLHKPQAIEQILEQIRTKDDTDLESVA